MMNREQIIKIFKNKNNLLIILIFIIGVVLMVAAGERGNNKKSVKNADGDIKAEVFAGSEKEERRLADILSEIEGAGDVSVMITYYSGVEKSLAYETRTASKEDKNERSEERKAVMTDGEPTVVKEVYPQVKGVIVTASGADKAGVKKALSDAVMASLDVPAHRICIFKKED